MWQGSEYFRRRRQFRFLQFQIFKRLNSIETQNFIPNFFRIGLKVIISNLLFPTWEWVVNFFSSICWMICREKFCRRKTNPSKTHLAERGAASNDICFSSNDNSGKFAPKRRITIEEHQFCHTQMNIEFQRRGKIQNWRKTPGGSESCFKTQLKVYIIKVETSCSTVKECHSLKRLCCWKTKGLPIIIVIYPYSLSCIVTSTDDVQSQGERLPPVSSSFYLPHLRTLLQDSGQQ